MSKVHHLLNLIEEVPQTATGHKAHHDHSHPNRLQTWMKKRDYINDKQPDIKISGTESDVKYLRDELSTAREIVHYPEKEKLYINGRDQSKFLVKQPKLAKSIKMKLKPGEPDEQSTEPTKDTE